MKKAKILLVFPYFKEKWNKLTYASKENLSINYLEAYLLDKGYDVTAINGHALNKENNILLEELGSKNFDIIAISCSPQKVYQSAKNFVKLAKVKYPKAHIVMGGIFPTMMYREILDDLPELDAVLRGEGEYSLEQMCEKIEIDNEVSFTDVSGYTYYNKKGELVKNNTKTVDNLDTLPFPTRRRHEFGLYNGKYTITYMLAGKGCYGRCSYCSIKDLPDFNNLRKRSPERVVEEMEKLIVDYGVEYINFTDDIFYNYSLNSQLWLSKFIKLINERNLRFKFRIYLRPNDVKENEIKKLAEIGLDNVFIGSESGIPRVLREMNKTINPEDTVEALKILRKYNVGFSIGFITIVPTMTFDELKENYYYLYKLRPMSIANYHNRLNVYAGTEYNDILAEQGLLNKTDEFWEKNDYSFLDKKVQKYHDMLQSIKENERYLSEYVDQVIEELHLINDEYESTDLSSIHIELWEEITQKLLQYVEFNDFNSDPDFYTHIDGLITSTYSKIKDYLIQKSEKIS